MPTNELASIRIDRIEAIREHGIDQVEIHLMSGDVFYVEGTLNEIQEYIGIDT